MLHMFSDLPAFRRDPLTFFLEKSRHSSAPLERLRVGPHPIYLVCDPALVKPIFKAPEAELDKGRLIYKMREVIGKSSLTMSGEPHRERRAAIHGEIARGITTTYVPEIASIVRRYVMSAAREGTFDAHDLGAPLALRIICDILFGRGALSSGDEAVLVNVIKLVEDDIAEKIFRVVPDLPWVHRRKKRKLREGRALMSAVVERARQRMKGASILKTLEGLDLEGEALSDEILLLILAGHHTTGSASAWLFYHMATEPGLADLLAREAASICDGSGEIVADSLARRAPISRAFVSEVLRLYPSSYWLSRETKMALELGGRNLKAGTSLIIAPWALGRDPRFWDRPERFDLNRSWMTNKAYIPFGVGPRACVGMGLAMVEMQLIALEFASAFQFTGVAPYPAPLPKPSVTLVPPPMRISVSPRRALPQVNVPYLPAA